MWCSDGTLNKYAAYFPLKNPSGRHTSFYDPKSTRFSLIDTCFTTHHLQFAEDANDTVYFSGTASVVGWVNTRMYDKTGDEQASQGWCPTVLDTNGDGKITKPWNEPGESERLTAGDASISLPTYPNLDPKLDTRFEAGSYGVITNPVDDSVWIAPARFPGRIVRMAAGSNPPDTCISEVYDVPDTEPDLKTQKTGDGARGIDVDRNGVIWTALASTAQLASFDRRKCAVLNGPKATGAHCPEGWTLYPSPGPTLKGTNIRSNFYYYNWTDQFNTFGLGENVPIATGTGSDSLDVLLPATREWIVLRVPYPLGFMHRGLDGRIDDPKAGWKGRGLWATYSNQFIWHTEGGKGTRSKLIHFQLRPDPAAR